MAEGLAVLLMLVLTIGLAVPLLPLARRLARQSVHGWKDAVLVALIAAALLYLTFVPASLLGTIVAYPIVLLIVGPILSLGGANVGQGAIAYLLIWVGAWAIAVFCAACLAAAYINDWWDRRIG